MKRLLVFALMFFSACLFSCSTQSFKQNLSINASSEGFHQKVDSIVIAKMNEYNIPGLSIGLVQHDSILYSKGYGVKDIRTGEPVTRNSIFHTASISKLFTAMAIMKLVEDDKLGLDDDLNDVLPELRLSDARTQEITIRHLLNHTSGFPDISDYQWENQNQSDTSLKNYVLGLNPELISAPSREFHYSNIGYNILGYVVEATSGMTFETYVRDTILDPAGMKQSDFRYYMIPDSLKTTPHSKHWLTQTIRPRKTYPYTREHAPSSTLNASSHDLSRWMIYFLRTLQDSSSSTRHHTMIKPSFDPYAHIGLGFQLYDFDGYKAVGHFGGDRGFRSFLLMIPEENIGLVVLGNADFDDNYRQEILYPIARLLLSQDKAY